MKIFPVIPLEIPFGNSLLRLLEKKISKEIPKMKVIAKKSSQKRPTNFTKQFIKCLIRNRILMKFSKRIPRKLSKAFSKECQRKSLNVIARSISKKFPV